VAYLEISQRGRKTNFSDGDRRTPNVHMNFLANIFKLLPPILAAVCNHSSLPLTSFLRSSRPPAPPTRTRGAVRGVLGAPYFLARAPGGGGGARRPRLLSGSATAARPLQMLAARLTGRSIFRMYGVDVWEL
jgi:hypothetical protein